jgi:hypothetical protein
MVHATAVGGGLPGHRSPSVGFEAPFEMLSACHERVERMLALLIKLRHHLSAHGWDDQAAKAATDVMRYFELAAPHHHLDEEMHVFPAILASVMPGSHRKERIPRDTSSFCHGNRQ